MFHKVLIIAGICTSFFKFLLILSVKPWFIFLIWLCMKAVAYASLCRRVQLLSALRLLSRNYGLPAVICVCMFLILHIPPFIFVTPLLIFLIWLCMKAIAYDVGCVRLPDSE